MPNVLVTGGAGDIGSAICRAFDAAGYGVALNYHTSAEKARLICESLGNARAFCADVSDSTQVDEMFEAVRQQFGSVEVVVCNSGVSSFAMFDTITDEIWKRTMSVNLDGCFYCCRAAIRQMLPKKRGSIINISSIWGICGGSCEVDYSASKAGVIGLTKALAKEVGPSGITVNCIAPGAIEGRMNSRLSDDELAELASEIPLGRLGTPDEIASAVLFLAQSPYITGQVISPNGGLVI